MSLKVDRPEENKAKMVLPKALEDALAMKTQRTLELGDNSTGSNDNNDQDADDDSEEETDMPIPAIVTKAEGRLDKNRRKKKRKKQNRQQRQAVQREIESKKEYEKPDDSVEPQKGEKASKEAAKEEIDVEIEYVGERLSVADLAPMYRQFYRVFEIFKLENKPKDAPIPDISAAEIKAAAKKPMNDRSMEEDDEVRFINIFVVKININIVNF